MIDLIRRALASRLELAVVYRSGSQPGAARVIVPIRLEGDNLRARCVASGQEKVFRLSLLDIPATVEGLPVYDPNTPLDVASLDAAVAAVRSDLEALGWVVHTSAEGVRLENPHARKNNNAAVGFSFISKVPDFVDAAGVTHFRAPKRPFYFYSPSSPRAKTFEHLESALDSLLVEAAKHAPNRGRQ